MPWVSTATIRQSNREWSSSDTLWGKREGHQWEGEGQGAPSPHLQSTVHISAFEVVISVGVKAQIDEELHQGFCISVCANPILGGGRGGGIKAHSCNRDSAQSSSAHLHPTGKVFVVNDETNTARPGLHRVGHPRGVVHPLLYTRETKQ